MTWGISQLNLTCNGTGACKQDQGSLDIYCPFERELSCFVYCSDYHSCNGMNIWASEAYKYGYLNEFNYVPSKLNQSISVNSFKGLPSITQLCWSTQWLECGETHQFITYPSDVKSSIDLKFKDE